MFLCLYIILLHYNFFTIFFLCFYVHILFCLHCNFFTLFFSCFYVYILFCLHCNFYVYFSFRVSMLTCSFACILICCHVILFARNFIYMLHCLHIILFGLWWKQYNLFQKAQIKFHLNCLI